jgi:uncharacterized phage protein (TIGR02218 family)
MPLTPDQLESLQKGRTALKMLIKVIQHASRGNEVLRVCLHTSNITFDSELYKASGFIPAEFEAAGGLDVSNTEVETLLSPALNALDLRGGKWQGARVEIRIVDEEHLERGAIFTQKGRFGMATINGRTVTMEYRANKSALAQPIGFAYSRICRDTLGGIYCTRDLTDITSAGTVGAVTNNQKFVISTSKPNDKFYRGKITFNSGANEGLSQDIQTNDGTTLILVEPMPGDVETGDTYTIVEGCDGTIERCDELGNIINHFAEEAIPEVSKMVKVVG